MRKNFPSEQMLYTVRQAESGTLAVGNVSQGGITEQPYTSGLISMPCRLFAQLTGLFNAQHYMLERLSRRSSQLVLNSHDARTTDRDRHHSDFQPRCPRVSRKQIVPKRVDPLHRFHTLQSWQYPATSSLSGWNSFVRGHSYKLPASEKPTYICFGLEALRASLPGSIFWELTN